MAADRGSGRSRDELKKLLERERYEEALEIEYGTSAADLGESLSVLGRWYDDDELYPQLTKAANALRHEDSAGRQARLSRIGAWGTALENDKRRDARLWAQQAQQDVRAVERRFRRLVAERGEPRDHFELGRLLTATGRAQEALEPLRRSAEQRPDADSRSWLGRALLSVGSVAEARQQFEIAKRLRGDAEDRYWLGFLLAATDARADAIIEFQRAISKTALPDYYHWLGRTLTEVQRTEDAVEPLREAVALRGAPEDSYWLGITLAQLGHRAEAVGHLVDAVAAAGSDTTGRRLLATLAALDRPHHFGSQTDWVMRLRRWRRLALAWFHLLSRNRTSGLAS